MLNFFICFIDFLIKRKCYKTQKFRQKIGDLQYNLKILKNVKYTDFFNISY